MKKTDLTIKDLKLLPDTMEVVGYGMIRPPRMNGSQMEMQLFLSAVRPDGTFLDRSFPPLSCWAGCGQLPVFEIGSRWLAGVFVGQRPMAARSCSAKATGLASIGRSAMHPADRNFFPFDGAADIPCYRLELDGNRQKVALVPVMEVVRAYFGVRSGFVRQLMDGNRDPTMTTRRFLFDSSLSKVEGRNVYLFCHSEPTRREAYIAASIMTDDRVRESHDDVCNGLRKVLVWDGADKAFVSTPFPFADTVKLSYESRWVTMVGTGPATAGTDAGKGAEQRRELITRILAFDAPLAFSKVEYDFPSSRTVAGLPPRVGRTMFCNADRAIIHTGSRPGGQRAAVVVDVPGPGIGGFGEIEFVRLPRIVSDSPERKGLVDQERDAIDVETDDAGPGGDRDKAPADIRMGREGADVPPWPGGARVASMIATDQAVIRLVRMRPGWTVSGGGDPPGAPPPLNPVGTGEDVIHVMELEVSTPLGPVLIIDAGTLSIDPRALGVVARVGMGAFDDDALSRLRSFVAKEGARWRKRQLAGFVVGSVVRAKGLQDDHMRYGTSIGSVVDKVIGEASP